MITDVSEASFEQAVVERSREVPVVVDFWAEWCGPCRQLTPALEAAARERDGDVDLAKVDTDANQNLAAAFGIRGIPAVKAFRNGQVVAEFTGAIPPAQVGTFFDGLVPTAADRLAAAGDEASLRSALEADPRHRDAALALGRILISRGDADDLAEARRLLDAMPGDFEAEGLAARATLAASEDSGELGPAFGAWDEGRYEDVLEALQRRFEASSDPDERDALRKVLVAIFTELGADHPLAREHRRRLAAALH